MKGIYCIENKVNGKKYYGSSINVSSRFARHSRDLRNGTHCNVHLQRSYNLYGIDAFTFTLIEAMEDPTRNELHLREQWYIDNNYGGYNIAPANGGDMLANHPNKDEIVSRRVEAHRLWLSRLTKEEKKEKYSKMGDKNPNWRNGGVSRKLCPTCGISDISSSSKECSECRDRSGENNPFYGKVHTEKTLAILRENGGKWIKGIDPSELAYTKCYRITYPDGSTKVIYGMKAIALEFQTSIANVDLTIDRMARGSMPTKRSRFFQHVILEISKDMV
jgi:group I intron endonuclease